MPQARPGAAGLGGCTSSIPATATFIRCDPISSLSVRRSVIPDLPLLPDQLLTAGLYQASRTLSILAAASSHPAVKALFRQALEHRLLDLVLRLILLSQGPDALTNPTYAAELDSAALGGSCARGCRSS